MHEPIPAALAFLAFGALLAGSAVLLLLNPTSRSVRWWVVFQAANLVWLGLQGWAFAVGAWVELRPLIAAVVAMLPVVFLAYALVEATDFGDRPVLAVLAVGLLPIAVLATTGWPYPRGVAVAWHALLWGAGVAVLFSATWRGTAERAPKPRLARAVVVLLLLVAPLTLAGAIAFGTRMFHYGMPLLVVWIQFLIFYGVARLRFYDIEVRAARSGELAAAAAEAERLAVVGELSASLAHEIRNPLTGVRSLAQRLAEDDVDESKRRRYAGVILEEASRVERLVTNLLDVSRRMPAAPAAAVPTPLAPLFDDLLLLLRERAGKAGVQLHADAGALVAEAPREPLAQALLNLLMNALAHAPRGTQVDLLARRDGDATELLVRDAGPGVPVAERDQIWEPFRSGGEGTGLGLAVVRRLARQHGWQAAVGDAPAGGAEFRLRLPDRREEPR